MEPKKQLFGAALIALLIVSPALFAQSTAQKIEQQKVELRRIQYVIKNLRPKIRKNMERVRFETLETYPFTAPLFIAIGHDTLQQMFRQAFAGNSGSGTLSIQATSFRYSWKLFKFETSTDNNWLELKASYKITLHGYKNCTGELSHKLRWTERSLVPRSLKASCETNKGLIGVHIAPDTFQLQIPFDLIDEFELLDNKVVKISGSLYYKPDPVGVILRGASIRVRK